MRIIIPKIKQNRLKERETAEAISKNLLIRIGLTTNSNSKLQRELYQEL